MEIKRGLSILFYMIFFIFLPIYGEYLEYIQLNEMYRVILILSLFFLDAIFCIYMNNIEDEVYKKLRVPYVILWSLIILSFSFIIFLSIEIILCFWAFLFIVYTLIKFFVYKKVSENPLEKTVLSCGKFRFIIMIIFFIRYNGIFDI